MRCLSQPSSSCYICTWINQLQSYNILMCGLGHFFCGESLYRNWNRKPNSWKIHNFSLVVETSNFGTVEKANIWKLCFKIKCRLNAFVFTHTKIWLCFRFYEKNIVTIRESSWLTDNTYSYEQVVRYPKVLKILLRLP